VAMAVSQKSLNNYMKERDFIGGVNIKTKMPLLTVVTVVRNSEDSIEQTILSIINQKYQNIEYIIIDGCSTDNTLKAIKKYEKHVDILISEPDKGIYDAMNKGIALANGQWLNFMNAGDTFFDADSCGLVAKKASCNNYDIIYGDVIVKDPKTNREILLAAKPLKNIWAGMVFHHQSAFIKLSILKGSPFELKYKIASDYNQIISLYLKNKSFYYIPHAVSKVIIGGISYSNLDTVIEKFKVIHNISPFSIKMLFIIPQLFFSIIRNILGDNLTNKLRRIKWSLLYK